MDSRCKRYTFDSYIYASQERTEVFIEQTDLESFHRTVKSYAGAFLNTCGGVIHFGVRKSGRVVGVSCPRSREDAYKLAVDEVMKFFQPKVSPSLYRLDFVPIASRNYWSDWQVISLHVSAGPDIMYMDGSCKVMTISSEGLYGPLYPQEIQRLAIHKYKQDILNAENLMKVITPYPGQRARKHHKKHKSGKSSKESAEPSGKSAESSGKSAEPSRKSAESSTQSAEPSRKSAESSRKSAESSRKSAESSRKKAESSTQSAEPSRKSAESSRKSAESSTQSAEPSRKSAESSRKSAELSRKSAESSTQSAEPSRKSAEPSSRSVESPKKATACTQTSPAPQQPSSTASSSAATALSTQTTPGLINNPRARHVDMDSVGGGSHGDLSNADAAESSDDSVVVIHDLDGTIITISDSDASVLVLDGTCSSTPVRNPSDLFASPDCSTVKKRPAARLDPQSPSRFPARPNANAEAGRKRLRKS